MNKRKIFSGIGVALVFLHVADSVNKDMVYVLEPQPLSERIADIIALFKNALTSVLMPTKVVNIPESSHYVPSSSPPDLRCHAKL